MDRAIVFPGEGVGGALCGENSMATAPLETGDRRLEMRLGARRSRSS